MITLTAGEISLLVGGELHCDRDLLISKAPVFDSRLATHGSFFLALKGEKSDGHDFVAQAYRLGSMFSLTTRVVDGPCIVVEDVMEALAILAGFIRSKLHGLTVVAITGSQGKTSTKDLLAHMLSAAGPTIAPSGSFNNDLGLPLTILDCDERTRFCILEMGARHKGDIARLCRIARPNIGVVLNVGTAHIGEFGSQQVIAETKGELIESLGSQGIAVLGSYDEFTTAMAKLHSGTTLTFGESGDVDVRATDIEIREGRPHFDLVTKAGRDAVGMRLIGSHQVSNALAAAAVGTALLLPLELIASSLSTAEISSKWRMELHEFDDLLIINDSYNANPASMAAALHSLLFFAQERGGQSWAFLGKMHELGESGATASADIGTLASEIGIDHLVAVNAPEYGSGVGAMQYHHVATIEAAAGLVEHIAPGDVVLVKASRAEGFEILAARIQELWSSRNGDDQ
ncbi:unannotated protein [freshwater metagenome]|uniref:UDP-MurNAc-pentapeptide synthetase n=1 Tax=freshwater metagenome TaxID=449393 RepID=A0A6J6QDT6_9ZZZZ|nr:UDP-N-acetylmuramoyl-tripeptide--D-alanyl-D-alanine ligase [Actinomycetota bacterium]MSW62548.1 UDP-N-acetylmuramoyl-tripeptide--D-alanyl-D-alanine ligase [Actinomycetota bacterium]MSX89917.1 UDP-N-acetylmuramoyl-tripeptide--D-alanyl-D-alanine ligase [Actinomycetota bacterium]MSZ63926.1 UDP-N-acetylmuramoyl-tripeptide--D-alanyl-D-alanine ligase [Actinomycetota bacterium]MTA57324.1 UDP-N-acetylmuramoyl-tripeptide--D-alanyl-D-alanine ligase [Actinomycetota bacterium]